MCGWIDREKSDMGKKMFRWKMIEWMDDGIDKACIGWKD